MVGVFTQTDIRDHYQVRQGILDGGHGQLNGSLGIVCLTGRSVFGRWYTEEDYSRNAQFRDLSALLDDLVHRKLINPGHGAYLLTDPLAVNHEQRIDEIIRRKPRFPDHSADRLCPPCPARSINRVLHYAILLSSPSATRSGSIRSIPSTVNSSGL